MTDTSFQTWDEPLTSYTVHGVDAHGRTTTHHTTAITVDEAMRQAARTWVGWFDWREAEVCAEGGAQIAVYGVGEGA